MIKYFLSISLLVVIAAIVSSCASGSQVSGGSGNIKLSSYKETTLSNGLRVLLVEDHSLPYISVGLLVKGGSSLDPLSKSGLASLTADLLERGTKNKSANEIADAFGILGTDFNVGVDYDYSIFSSAALANQQDQLLDLFFEVITQPAFSNNEVERLRSEVVAQIKRAYDQPRYVAGKLFSQYLFGPHPYGRPVEGGLRDIKTIKQKDIIRNYLRYFRPNNAVIILVGDIRKGLVADLEKKLANWQSRPMDPEALPNLTPLQGQHILFAYRNDLKQSEVRIGQYGIKRNNADYLPLMVAETILSESLYSRLAREIRVKRGLTYGISSNFNARKDIGPYVISTNTRNDKVGEVVQETIRVMNEFVKDGVTDTEVAEAKGFLKGSFPTSIETPEKLAQILLAYRVYGVDDTYLTNFISRLNKLTKKDIDAVIKKYYTPQNYKIFVYGPKAPVLEQLRPLGAVEAKPFIELL